MNEQPTKADENFVESVYFTRDARGVLTGGKTIIRHTPDGRECSRFGYDPTGHETYHQMTEYHDTETGREIITHTFLPDNSLVQRGIGRFNQQGDLIELIKFNAVGNITDRQTYTYTSDRVHYSRYDEHEELIESWTRAIS